MALLRSKTLEKYVALATPILRDVARGRREDKFISYSELMHEMGGGPGCMYIGQVLEEVSCNEHEQKRPLLTALVVRETEWKPGSGFWRIRVLPEWVKTASGPEKLRYWRAECEMVWGYWGSD